ncbi:MAG: MBL fold metallo-hydrolase [Sphingobacteriaceae bacterium]|nr:MAG: MBL fold metallo-hydrolase [Sphingobacteriaceae bacterium]
MKIEQIYTGCLAEAAYYVESNGEVAIIDPLREVSSYLKRAEKADAKIKYIFETHFHADFVSGHLDLSAQSGAPIVYGPTAQTSFPAHIATDGEVFKLGALTITVLHTPGHTNESVTYLLKDEAGKPYCIFTGDTLFIGDCGRPDLRETAGNITATREDLAKQMYHSLRKKLSVLDDAVLVYPAHGAGTLCGKALSEANCSTIGAEKLSNWSLSEMHENQFVKALLEDQPFVPKYFAYDVDLNKKGAPNLAESVAKIEIKPTGDTSFINPKTVIIDTRPAEVFKNGYLPNSINLLTSGKLETWLGSIIAPGTPFYLVGGNAEQLTGLIERIAKIGYEVFIAAAFVLENGSLKADLLDLADFKTHPENYQIVDIRNPSEVKQQPGFEHSLHISLPELMDRATEIPTAKPVVVHCAGGYRSAAGSSIIKNLLPETRKVYDLSTAVTQFL